MDGSGKTETDRRRENSRVKRKMTEVQVEGRKRRTMMDGGKE